MNSKHYHIIFIDDDIDFLQSMNIVISSKQLTEIDGIDIEYHYMNNAGEALTITQELIDEKENIAVIVSDQQMPQLTGIEFMEKANKIAPKAVKMLLTGYASLDSAKYAINNRILDQYISKPIEDYENFASLIRNAVTSLEKEHSEIT